MNIFKCLDVEYKKSCLELSRVEVNSNEYYVVKKRQEALYMVLGVLKSYTWVKREEVRKKIKYFMENQYDYDALAREFNISKKSAYVMVSRASRQFKDAIGVNYVVDITKDNFSIENIKINDDSVSNIFITDIRDILVARESEGLDLKECILELMTLKNLTKATINNRVKRLDRDKIAHIIFLLQTDEIDYILEKELVVACLGGVIKSKEELEVRLKELS